MDILEEMEEMLTEDEEFFNVLTFDKIQERIKPIRDSFLELVYDIVNGDPKINQSLIDKIIKEFDILTADTLTLGEKVEKYRGFN